MFTGASKFTSLFLCLALAVSVFIFFPGNILSWDVFGYYLYLPLIFIYKDLGIHDYSIIEGILKVYENTGSFYQAVHLDSGEWIVRYTAGTSVLYAPFFFTGHCLAAILGYPLDGFSLPYQYSIVFGSLIYTFTGIYFLRKVLLEFFSELVTSVVMIVIVLGTNYFLHTSMHGQGAMTHNYLFTLYAVLLWYTIRWHKEQKVKNIAWMGFACGLIILIRPPEIVCVVIPALWGITNMGTLRNKFVMIARHRFQILLFTGIIALTFLPQCIYWKLHAGKFLFNAYGSNPGEGFEFFQPFILQVLFSFRKGWLVYTPVMIFSLWGFYHLYRLNKEVFVPAFFYFVFNFFIVASWSAWWYADSFGQRALIPSYAALSLPLGYFVSRLETKRIRFSLFAGVVLFFIFLNLFQSWQTAEGILHTSRNSREYYFSVFGKTYVTENDRKLLLADLAVNPDKIPDEREYTRTNSFELDYKTGNPGADTDTSIMALDRHSLILKANARSVILRMRYKNLVKKSHAWLRIQLWVDWADPGQNPTEMRIAISHHGWPYKYKIIKLQDTLNLNKSNLLETDYLTPEVRSKDDSLKIEVWNKGKEAIMLGKFTMDVYEPKFDPSIF